MMVRLPSLSETRELPWSLATSRRRGLYGFDSTDARSRSFNLIRGRLAELRRTQRWRLVGVVSATPNVGKSFVSANLAAALSRDPRFHTYLLDLDLRRGALQDIFGIEVEHGIAEYLNGTGPQSDIEAFSLQGQRLVIIPSKPGFLRSAELLAGDRTRSLLQAMRNSPSENYFLVDLPPVFANDDAATALEMLDSYILIAEEGKTTQKDVESAVDMLGEETLAGVIINKYRGGLVSEGRGIEERYATGYYGGEGAD